MYWLREQILPALTQPTALSYCAELFSDRDSYGPARSAHEDARALHQADGLQPVGVGGALRTPQVNDLIKDNLNGLIG